MDNSSAEIKIQYEGIWDNLFGLGIIHKAVSGLLELFGGLGFMLVGKSDLIDLFSKITRGEILEDPNDLIINFCAKWLQQLSSDTKFFVAAYILFHGVLNLFLSIQLFRKKLWAYKVAMSVSAVFILYQIYRITHTHSTVLILITLWDAIFIGVTWHQYKKRRLLDIKA